MVSEPKQEQEQSMRHAPAPERVLSWKISSFVVGRTHLSHLPVHFEFHQRQVFILAFFVIFFFVIFLAWSAFDNALNPIEEAAQPQAGRVLCWPNDYCLCLRFFGSGTRWHCSPWQKYPILFACSLLFHDDFQWA